MFREYMKIRHRYEDILCGVSDYQMFRDIRLLLRYIELLHEQLAQYMTLTQARMTDPSDGEIVH